MANVEIRPEQDVHYTGNDTPFKKNPTGMMLGWLKKNLFSSWSNIILTIIAAFITYLVLKGTIRFLFVTAEWSVVSANFRLLMVGQFPADQLWRVWAGVTLLSALLGLAWGLWKGTIGHVALTISGIYLVCAILPFIQASTRIWLLINLALLVAAFFIGRAFHKLKIPTLVLWMLCFPIILIFLNGLGFLKPVGTNLWGGFLLTFLIALVAIVCSFPLGVLLALGRRSKLPAIKWFCITYIELIRGVPLITVLFVAQIMLPLFLGDGVELNNVLRAMIAFTLFSAAYLAENIRGGLQSIPRGQFEAAQALGLSVPLMNIFIILPQALRTVIPAIVGLYIGIFKDTVLVAVVGLTDILGMAQKVVANPQFLGRQMETFLFVAFVFFIFCYLMSHVSRRLEASLDVGKR